MKYAIYDTSGTIIRTGSCQECDIELQASDDEFLYIGEANQLTQKVVDGELVEFETEIVFDKIREIRLDRNALLSKSDWTQLPDSPLNEEQKAAWAEYRQALRDIPNTGVLSTDLIQWPQPPED